MSTSTVTSASDGQFAAQPERGSIPGAGWCLALVATSVFMLILDVTIVSAALAGCNTWQGAKQDAKEVGGTVTNAVGTGLDKAGDGLNTAGEKVKGVGKTKLDRYGPEVLQLLHGPSTA